MSEFVKYFTNLRPWMSLFAWFRRSPQQNSTPPSFRRHYIDSRISSRAPDSPSRCVQSRSSPAVVWRGVPHLVILGRQDSRLKRRNSCGRLARFIYEARRQFISDDGSVSSSSSGSARCVHPCWEQVCDTSVCHPSCHTTCHSSFIALDPASSVPGGKLSY